MNKQVIRLILINILNVSTTLAADDVSCPNTITMDQLSTLNKTGNITINDVLFEAQDREAIKKITPASYHLSAWTALAKLRKSEFIYNQLVCHYGYKGSMGNIGSKVSASVTNTSKETLNQQYDYTFTIIHQLPTVTTTTETITESIEKDIHPYDTEEKHPPIEITTEVTIPVQQVMITKEEIAKNTQLSNNLKLLKLSNKKVTEKIVDLQYSLLVKSAKSQSLDLTQIDQAYNFVKEYFAAKRNQF